MPAQRKNVSGQSWGITYADVGDYQDAVESTHSCTLEWGIVRYAPYKGSNHKIWEVVCTASIRRGKPDAIVGLGQCQVGGNRGAASMAGAYLRSAMSAIDNLEARKTKPRHAPEQSRLPGT